MSDKNMNQCKYCGHTVAKGAKTCPQCGGKLKKNRGLIVILVVLGIIGLIVVGMFATGNARIVPEEERKVTVITNSGEEIETTFEEIEEIYAENEALYEKEYMGAKVSYVLTVVKVETGIYIGIGTNSPCFDVIYANAHAKDVYLYQGTFSNLDEIKEGDKIHVESQLQDGVRVYSMDTVLTKE